MSEQNTKVLDVANLRLSDERTLVYTQLLR